MRMLWRLVLAATFIGASLILVPIVRPSATKFDVRTAKVERIDFRSSIVAAGRVESTSNTEIRCALERVGSVSNTTILSLAPDGQNVKKGDVLGELDASGYEELVRQQTINVQQARATHRQAELSLEVARLALTSYREGELLQSDSQLQATIALAESDLNRQVDRLQWTRRMFEKGYVARSQVETDEMSLTRIKLTLAQARSSYGNFKRFTEPIQLKVFQSSIQGAEANLGFETIRLKREEEKLELYQRMVDSCVIRAPHDGFLLYANRSGREQEVYPGATVRQRQTLFALPDLTKMEVQVLLHETIVTGIQPGMPATVHVEALPGRTFGGVVTSVSPLPMMERKAQTGSTDVTYFLGHVQLTTDTNGLSPGMTAELEITLNARRDVLAVPYEAVKLEGDSHVCLVAHPEHRERRKVKVGEANHNWFEVTGGLREGEEVVVGFTADDETGPRPKRWWEAE